MESIVAVGREQLGAPDLSQVVRIDYVNYRGERAVRRVVPQRL